MKQRDSSRTPSHYEGFEREEKFHAILADAIQECPKLKVYTIKKIIRHVAPDFLEGLFEMRPCVRRLRYTGWWSEDGEHILIEDPFFELHEIYTSIACNGATYTIEGFGDGKKPIGIAYFERV